MRVPERGAVKPGEYAVQVQLRPDANDSVVLTDTARVVMTAPRGEELGTPVVWRRGPSTGPRHLQTADTRFSRSERIRLELATTVPGTAAARLLDRAGQPLQVPVQVSARPDDSGRVPLDRRRRGARAARAGSVRDRGHAGDAEADVRDDARSLG